MIELDEITKVNNSCDEINNVNNSSESEKIISIQNINEVSDNDITNKLVPIYLNSIYSTLIIKINMIPVDKLYFVIQAFN
jgi:hypothetical protein